MNRMKSVVLSTIFLGCISSILADQTSDIKKRAAAFCDTKVKLTEDNINFSVKNLITLSGASKSSVTLDSVSVVQIATMRLNCNLLIAGLITPDQFLVKQTEILQFAVDVDTVTKVAESKAAAPAGNTNPSAGNTSGAASSTNGENPSSNTTGDKAGSQTQGNSTTTKVNTPPQGGKNGTQTAGSSNTTKANVPAQDGSNKAGAQPSPPTVTILEIAHDLGVTLKINAGTVEAGGQDYVDSAITRLVAKYSPIAISQ